MATSADHSTLDCPVCGEHFTAPKLLHCNHVVCKRCIVNWLGKAGRSGGCPLCRAPILPPSPAPHDDLEGLVDALPTDLVLVAQVGAEQLLTSAHVCTSCDASLAATSLCLQCRMKLCAGCTTTHKRIPALRSHEVAALQQLRAERVAAAPRVSCQSHDDRLAELFCSAHGVLICGLCSSTSHRQCPVQILHQAAVQKRQQLKRQIQGLRDSEARLRTQIKQSKDKLADTRTRAQRVFEKLHQCVERQRQQVENRVQAWEAEMGLSQLQQLRADMASLAAVLETLLQSAAEDAVLAMHGDINRRVELLAEREAGQQSVRQQAGPACVELGSRQLIQQVIAALGQHKSSHPIHTPREAGDLNVQAGQQSPPPPPPPPRPPRPSSTPPGRSVSSVSTPPTSLWRSVIPVSTPPTPLGRSVSPVSTPPTPPGRSVTSMSTPPTPRGSALAKVLKVGDRVQANLDFGFWPPEFRGRHGTVTAIPSRRSSSQGISPKGCVEVLWDDGQVNWYCMGWKGKYHLDLVSLTI